ncbi:MAG: MG2 domain-containing protein [Candidatus Aminicenantes bacterium]|nr:MG2 domain-containing protein [Candidatus Aminicenantes bacterium]
MKPKTKRVIFAIFILALILLVPGGIMRGKPAQDKAKVSTDELWKKVEAADRDGLPKTAIGHLKEIVQISLEQKREGEALRALTRQLVLESVVEGNKPEARVVRIREEIEKAPAGMKTMLRVILAQWYRHYYSRNRWRFMERSATAGGIDEKDFTTWDLRRIIQEIDSLYQDILKDEAVLKKTPVSVFRDFLEPGDQPATIRPTLYDFVAFEALEFYASGERAAAAPEDAFVLESDSPALGPAAEFIRYKPGTTDADSPTLRALLLYQNLLDFHRGDTDRDVLLDADIHRLEGMKNMASGESVSARYLERLKEISEKNPASVLSSLADYLRAREVRNQGDLVQAYALADRGRKAHPLSLGGKNCDALISEITARDFDVLNERVVPPGKPSRLAVRYRNLTALHFRAVKEDFDALLPGKDAGSLFWMNDEHVQEYLRQQPAAAWSVDLPATADYQQRTELVELPSLAPGFYRLLASVDKPFSRGKNKISAGTFWVSEWGIVTGGTGKALEGFIVRNETGDPVPNAAVVLYEWNYGTDVLQKRAESRTDALGAFVLSSPESYSNRVLVARGAKGTEVVETQVQMGYAGPTKVQRRTVFFTDRSLYRPGQTIHFKGLCLSVDENRSDYKALAGQSVRVVLRDANQQEVSVLQLTSNDFGSVSGTFTAPADRLTGAMTILTENPQGSCTVRVEEYKRPKFQVKIDVPDKEFRLNDEVTVPGEAVSYTGAPIDGALVKYRVVREVRYPVWWYFPSRSESQEIAHGTIRTDATGKFTIVFAAKPDPAVSASSQPVFTYAVTADVTDGTGETRSAAGYIRVGFTAIEADLSGSDWQEKGKPVVLSVTTTTLNGKPAAAKGVVEIYALRGPDRPVPRNLFGEEIIRTADQGSSRTPDWRQWPEGGEVGKKEFAVAVPDGSPCRLSFDLEPGAYRAILKTKDSYGTAVESRVSFLVLDPASGEFPVRIPFHVAARTNSLEPGETYEMLWGTGYDRGPVLIEVYQNGRRLQRFWTKGKNTQAVVRLPVDEASRGGFTVSAVIVKENRLYREDRRVYVPWSNKRLDLQWKTFRSKLRPGQDETWSLLIKGPKAEIRAAEMVASLYDASLDQFYPHGFGGISGIFRSDATYLRSAYANRAETLRAFFDELNRYRSYEEARYVRFPDMITESLFDFDYGEGRVMMAEAVPSPMAAAQEMKDKVGGGGVGGVLGGVGGDKGAAEPAALPKVPDVDLSKVQARRNLDETAFFYPHLMTDAEGTVTLEFKMPEALTEWRFLGFAHTPDLLSGSIEAVTVTQKELMVQPNPPRFLREGDALEYTVKVTNMTEKDAAGAVELRFFDPRSEKTLDGPLRNANPKLPFSIPAKQSRSFSWPISVPDGMEAVGFKAVAATTEFSDGEEGMVPVLSRSLLVRESIPLWISDKGQKHFTFEKLVKSSGSATLRHLNLTVQMASNPAWYAVQALPYLMEYPYECSEQVFNRLYANALAKKIAGSDPKIRRIFDLWKGTPALQSNLEKNEDLKSVLLQESPWVIEAKTETQAKRNIGLLFDENTMKTALGRAMNKLADMQLSDGSWPWFPGGPGNDYITLYIVTGFGRLKHLGVTDVVQDPAIRAIGRLDSWIREAYEDILKHKTEGFNNLSPSIALYLYARSFYLDELPVPAESKKAVDYFLGQGAAYWLQLDNRQSQAHLALGLNRFGDTATAQKIMRSMKERSKVDEELGRYWAERELSWWWYRAPIETQAMMIEAFDEVMKDSQAVEECRIWLLKQKQTQDWKTTKATADAVYGLILRGTDLLASDEIVEVTLGGMKVEPEKVEAGTGFYEKRYTAPEIKAAMGEIEVRKADKGVAWGGVHWQYMEDISKITPHEQNPLRLKKFLFKKTYTKKGPEIEPVKGPLAVGDTLVVRIELRTDRDMEYVHMKDHRGSGLEPVNVLSQYKFQDGLAYYEATKDTATHFFIDYLPKGTYVFEYDLRVQHRGTYQNGMAHIECMYAPEFNSHSESLKLEVR